MKKNENLGGVSNFDGTFVFFCNSEENARKFLQLPGNNVVGQDYNPFLPEDMRDYAPIRRRDVSRIQVDYVNASPFRVRQMSVTEWKKRLGLLPKRKKLPVERPLCIEALASCMMKNGVR